MWLFALFVVVPLIEIALFITVGSWLTLWPTLFIILGSAVIGVTLMRRQGLQTLAELRRAMAEGRDPTPHLADGAMVLLAGALLVTPGFLTDAVGYLLLVPAVRRAVFGWLIRNVRFSGFVMTGAAARGNFSDGQTIDGDFEVVDPAPRPTHPQSNLTRH